MQLTVCKECGRLFEAMTSSKLCPTCLLTNQTSFMKVKEYLREHPGTSLTDLSEEIGVSIALIEHYLAQERIEIAPGSPVMLACSECGKGIVTGIYCEDCSHKIKGELQKIKNTLLAEEKEANEDIKGKMRYIPAKWHTGQIKRK